MVTKLQHREEWKRRTSSVNRVKHCSRRARRRLRYHLLLWMWRKSMEKYHVGFRRRKSWFWIAHGWKRGRNRCRSKTTASLLNRVPQNGSSVPSNLGKTPLKLVDPSEPFLPAKSDMKTHTICSSSKKPLKSNDLSGRDADSQNKISSFLCLKKHVHEYLEGFYRRYGSFVPFQEKDALDFLQMMSEHQNKVRKNLIMALISSCLQGVSQTPACPFRVVFKKHVLTLEDLSTLAEENWLNDQVMNMYGELIMDSAKQKVHFHNSFFYQQLMAKGFEGVKRWTKQVQLFSHKLLLVLVHLEVHWCLVAVDLVQKTVSLYDSQDLAPREVSTNILKYLIAEAKEKQLKAFENGWKLCLAKKVPLQMNENDCGVFVLEYARCLAFEKPLRFTQKEIPLIRKRIYKELCDSKIQD
ncbi:sentrin-specific protease 5-like isoform 3-T3 [Synchiropus picturatus]